jgi:hypothetical protein
VSDDPRWPGVLDAIERDARRLTAGVDEPGTSYEPPADLGPLPATLRGRAGEVLGHLDVAVRSIETQLGEIRTELGRVRRETGWRSTPGHEPNGGFDTLA